MSLLFHKKHMIACLILGFIALLCCPSIVAEDGSKDTKKEERPAAESAHFSLIALGPVPQRRYKISGKEISGKSKSDESGDRAPQSLNLNSIPVLLPPLAGAVPPSSLYYELLEVSDDRSWGRARVGFNASTSVTKVHAGVPLSLSVKERTSTNGYQPYLNLPPLKPGSQSIFFLLPSRKGKTPWKKIPSLHTLDMGSQALLGKSILVKNFSNKPVVFSLDDNDPIRLRPGEQKSYELVHKKGRLHRMAATYLTKRVVIFKSALRVPDGALSIFAFHNTNPKTNGGKKVGVVRVVMNQLSPEELNKKMTLP